MKKSFFVIWIIFIFWLGYLLFYNSHINSFFSLETYTYNMQKYMPDVFLENNIIRDSFGLSYHHKWNKVFYGQNLLTWVKANNFIVLDQFWIDSLWHVYSQDMLLSWLDWKSVQFYPYNIYYIRDKNGFYFINWSRLDMLFPEWIFQVFTWISQTQFACDDKNFYIFWKVLSWIQSDQVLFFADNSEYFTASWNIFWWTLLLSGADVNTFQILSWPDIGYAKDKNHTYYLGKIVSEK